MTKDSLIKGEDVSVDVRFRGGTTRSFTLPRLRPAQEEKRTPEEAVQTIDRLLDQYTCGEVATILNERGLRSGTGKIFHRERVTRVQEAYQLRSREERLRSKGLLTRNELGERLGIDKSKLAHMLRRNALPVRRHNLSAARYMYEFAEDPQQPPVTPTSK